MSTQSELKFNAAVVALAVVLSLLPHVAEATLGETEASVVLDGQQLHSAVKMTDRTNYRVHEIKLASGTAVREFSAEDGTVYAVAWSGPSLPDLRQTLGRYFEIYTAGAKASRSGHTHLQFQQNGLVVEASGRMRAFKGRAYLPQSIPVGASLDEVR